MSVPINALSVSPPRHDAAAALAREVREVREVAGLEHEKKLAEAKPAQVGFVLAEINQTFRIASIGVRFEFDKEADTMIAKVVDVESGEVIRQMPSEDMVRITKALGKLQGLLVH